MKFKNAGYYFALLAILLTTVFTLGQQDLPVFAAGTAVVSVSTSAESIKPGEQFTLSILVQPDSPIAGAQFNISFDPSLVSALSVTEGNLFSQGGAGTYFLAGNINNTAGTITGVAGVITGSGQTVTGSETFATISMTASANSGICPFTLSNVIIGNIDGQSITVNVVNGQIVVGDVTTTSTTTTSSSGGGGGGGGGGGSSEETTTSIELTGLDSSTGIELNSQGLTTETTQLNTTDGVFTLQVASGTSMLDSNGDPLATLSVSEVDTLPNAPDEKILYLGYEFGPTGAQFDPAIVITMTYDPQTLPVGIAPSNFQVAYWNGSSWVIVKATIDTAKNTITFSTTHFTIFALLFPDNVAIINTPVPTSTTPTSTAITVISTPTPTETPAAVSTSIETISPMSVITTSSTNSILTEVTTAVASSTDDDNPSSDNIPTIRMALLAFSIGIAAFIITITATIIWRRRHIM